MLLKDAFPTRRAAIGALEEKGITTVQQAQEYGYDKIVKLRNCGSAIAKAIVRFDMVGIVLQKQHDEQSVNDAWGFVEYSKDHNVSDYQMRVAFERWLKARRNYTDFKRLKR